MADPSDGNKGDRGAGDIRPILITDEMKRSYLDYAMSVIVSRALPDVRDGLKPVHRRILFSMSENGYSWNKPYRKSARIVGDVIGKYHPHGDQSVYDALVRMVQDFSMRVPLIDGQGNFGSVDGDPPAAMRYTEVRLQKISDSLLNDLENDTVDFQDNYDNSEREPTVLPARFPNLLVNGAGGIAVGMATNIPPHNLGEVIDACLAFLENPALSIEQLMEHIPGPDFPTGGVIMGRAGIRAAYLKGRGSVVVRGKVHVETIRKDRDALIVTEIPYQVNKATLQERIAELVREKRVEGISDVRDESDRSGYRVVIELKRDAMPDVVLNQLYRFTSLQSVFAANMVALNSGRPEQHTLLDFIQAFTQFRETVITRRTKFLLGKARDRAHVLVGLATAVANIDEVIKLIRSAPDPASAREALMSRDWPADDIAPLLLLIEDPRSRIHEGNVYRLSIDQAKAILELRLQRLTALGRDEIADELKALADKIRDYLNILSSRARVISIVRDELTAIKEEFATPRRTEILDVEGEVDDEDLIQKEDMVVTVSHRGYIKRVPLSTYRAQRRGGKGRSGMTTRDEDFVTRLFVANTHTPVLFLSSRGMAYKMKVWRLPLSAPQARGKALINLLPLQQDETITSILPLPEERDESGVFILFATRSGNVRRNELADFAEVRQNGKIAMKLDPGDDIAGAQLCRETDDILLTTANGQAIRFPVTDVRIFKGRESTGVRGVRLDEDDTVISLAILRHMNATPAERAAYLKQANAMRRAAAGERAATEGDIVEQEAAAAAEAVEALDDGEAIESTDIADLTPARYGEMGAAEQYVLTMSERGFGKRTSSYEYRTSGRGGKGIIAMAVNERNGRLIASFPVEDTDQIMLVTNGGKLIRCPIEGISITGRSAQGVTIFRTDQDERVVSAELISDDGTGNGNGDGPDAGGDAEGEEPTE
ncbi:DNA gyrase, A subunit [Rhodomicrobium vannielii ATCC 17100]|uniref:DNA gyrase subunit A n=1 Tax=Rhodomicrobium vannielii (strain ATCC 17100 / DSM 162 / LMG 4299 / NCIMB 10020 / ATH 3.1.1) TaxID=648757 RepID=E3I2T2_RHOVT|nr:DNA gyrase subunit A [Rhodomicrobium vannielii]ADP72527.1 DNA gyrase, A subunit [Rhodomicrobium vannielii ATCC 17100]